MSLANFGIKKARNSVPLIQLCVDDAGSAATSAKPKLRHAKVTPQLADGAQGIWISYLAAHPRGHRAEHRQQIRPG